MCPASRMPEKHSTATAAKAAQLSPRQLLGRGFMKSQETSLVSGMRKEQKKGPNAKFWFPGPKAVAQQEKHGTAWLMVVGGGGKHPFPGSPAHNTEVKSKRFQGKISWQRFFPHHKLLPTVFSPGGYEVHEEQHLLSSAFLARRLLAGRWGVHVR